MAASGMYSGSAVSAPKVVALPQQKKIMDDVLECIIQLKSEFFENHQPINDDNISLQRLCAKLEHLIQMGMREKTSLLGRKKDYWDYFCDCLGSAKGSNDGIRYVKNLRENKTSLGRGRAFIRFCLVHQRLADAMQQCLTHEKTSLWFLPSSVLCNQKTSPTLISALYDLNSMHFDLAPRGYDLDSDWPSFANRKTAPGGSWNIPISRRSSITSMDTISQASLCLATSPEVDRLHKDLEAAHSARYEASEQLGTLQKEKEEVSQSAWESQGKVVALQEQLNTSQTQHASLQERYRELDVNFVKIKLERDHLEKLLSDEKKNAEEHENKRVQQLQGEEEVWKREMREEGERRRKEIDKLKEELRRKKNEDKEGRRTIESYCSSLVGLMADCKIEVPTSPKEDFETNLSHIQEWLEGLQTRVAVIASEKDSCQSKMEKLQLDHDTLMKQAENQQQEVSTASQSLTEWSNQISSLKSNLEAKSQKCDSLNAQIVLMEKDKEKHGEEIVSLKELNSELRDKEKTLKELNETMKERIGSECLQNLPLNAQIEFGKYLNDIFEHDERVLELQQQMLAVERDVLNHAQCNGDGEKKDDNDKPMQSMNKFKSCLESVLKEREENLRVMLSGLQAIEMKSGKFEREVEMLEHGGQVLNEQLSLSEAKVEFFSSKFKDEEAKFAEMKAKHEEMVEKVKAADVTKAEIERERNELRSHFDEKMLQLETVCKEKEELVKTLEDGDGKRQKLQTELNSAHKEIEKITNELSGHKERVTALVRDTDSDKESHSEILAQISTLQLQNEEIRKEKDDIMLNFDKERCDLKKKCDELETEKELLLTNTESLKDNVCKEEQLKAEHIEKEHFEILDQLNNEVLEALSQCKKYLKLNSQEIEEESTENLHFSKDKVENGILKEKVNENMKHLLNKIKDLCDSHEKTEENTTNQISAALEEEKERLLSEVDAALEETHHIKSQLEQTSELLTVSNSSLDTISNEKESLQSKVNAMMEEISQHESEKDELKREMSVLKADCERAEDGMQEKLGEKRELEVRLEETEEQLREALCEKSKLEQAAEGLYSQSEFSHQVLEESLADSQRALEILKGEKLEREEKCSWLETERKSLEERLQASNDACQAMKQEVEKVQAASQSNDDDDEVTSLRRKLDEEKAKYELEIDTLNSEISSLQFQMSSAFIEEQAELQTSQSMRETQVSVEELEEVVKQLEEENDSLRKRREEQGSEESAQQNDFMIRIKSQEEKLKNYERKMIELQTVTDASELSKEEMSLDLTRLQLSSKKRIEGRDKELEVLRSDNAGMKKQLLKLIKDKDNLWQKTDALVDERKKKASEKWMDNSKVNFCGLCKAEFSLFLRKHHCRLCGKIFCWACSDNWLDTAHSSQKSRVCTECFDQKTNPDSSLMATSLLENESDIDDDDGTASRTSSFLHTFNEAGNVEIKEVFPPGAKNVDDDDPNETDEGKLLNRTPFEDMRRNGNKSKHNYEMETDSLEDSIYNANAEIRVSVPSRHADNNGGGEVDNDDVDDSVYQVITQAEVAKTMTDYKSGKLPEVSASANQHFLSQFPGDLSRKSTYLRRSSMGMSMVLSADELEAGEVNRQNEVWIKPGKQYAVPIQIGSVGGSSTLSWEFTSQPKDIVFSIKFCKDESVPLLEAEEIVAPCKCDAHKQMHRGELMPKRPGIYTLFFDNSYSRMTSKKVHYQLQYRKSP